jgi:hypothetical protein
MQRGLSSRTSVADPGCLIPDPNNFPSRIRTFFITDTASYIKKEGSKLPFFLLFKVSELAFTKLILQILY